MALLCTAPRRTSGGSDDGGQPSVPVTGTPVVKICCRSVRIADGNAPGSCAQTTGTFGRKFGFVLFANGCEPGVGLIGFGVLNDVPPPPAKFGAMIERAKTS